MNIKDDQSASDLLFLMKLEIGKRREKTGGTGYRVRAKRSGTVHEYVR